MFRTLFKKTPPTKIRRPNPSAKNDPMVILSLSTFREKNWFDLLFPIEIPLFHEKSLFHFKPSGIYIYIILYLKGFCSPLNVFLSYYIFLFLAPWRWPWLPGCSARGRPERTAALPEPLLGRTGAREGSGSVTSSQLLSITSNLSFLELVTGSAGATEVVARSAARSSLPHAPGARMTVVTLTPSNHFLLGLTIPYLN